MSLKHDGGEYLWQGDERFWPRRAPVLFPIVGVLRGGHATSAQGEVTLNRHGIARLYDHAVVERTASSVTYELDATDETRAAYPLRLPAQHGLLRRRRRADADLPRDQHR